MITTTIKQAVIGRTYKNTGGATVVVVPDQEGVAAGYRRISVAGGRAFVAPDGIQVFLEEEEGDGGTFSAAVAKLAGGPLSEIALGVGALTDAELDELADADTRSEVLRSVAAEQGRRSKLAATPPAPADVTTEPARQLAPPDAPQPALEPDGWLPRSVTCGYCGAKATTEWAVAVAAEVLANHRDPATSKLCTAVGHHPDAAAGLRPAPTPAVNPEAYNLGSTPPAPHDLAGPPPPAGIEDDSADHDPDGDPWNGIAEDGQEERMLLVKNETNLTNLARMAQTTRLARVIQEIERQSLAVGEVRRHAERMRDGSTSWGAREGAANAILAISRRARTAEARPGVARLAVSLAPDAEEVVRQARAWRDEQLAAAIRVAGRSGPERHTLDAYPSDPPEAAVWLARRMPSWPAPLVATLVDLTGSVRSCKDTIRALDLHARATQLDPILLLQLAARYEREHEGRDTLVQDLARAIRARDPSAPSMAPETEMEIPPVPAVHPQPTPPAPADVDCDGPAPTVPAAPVESEGDLLAREQLELERAGQTVLPGLSPAVATPAALPPAPADVDCDDEDEPAGPVREVAPRGPLDPLPEDVLQRLREANRQQVRVIQLPAGGSDVYVRVGSTWTYVAPLGHPDLAQFERRLLSPPPALPDPLHVPAPDPAWKPTIFQGPSQEDEDALAIGRAVLAAKRLGISLRIDVGGAS